MSKASGQRTDKQGVWRHWLLWCLLLGVWSVALLTPHPVEVGQASLPPAYLFVAAKVLHVSAYALLAWLAARLPAPRRARALVLAVLAAHALTTELLQRYVRLRSSHWRDVGLDLLGVLLGLALSCSPWRAAWSSARRSDSTLSVNDPNPG